MRELRLTSAGTLPAIMDDLFQTFGFRRIVGAFLLAAWRRRRTLDHVSHLSDRMLRDIGVEEGMRKPAIADISLWQMPVGYPVTRHN
ncbi:DUF1127 domain-containing protein [Ensifer adhaerens]|uniref:DUF1127 domain-containing protein n=1 Tax=Ensifer adhaerens TaxID=106592 RepID=UPI0023A9A4BD|nr:DUF1127 domain-containing protein [Ensifer adhaerens]WDZ78798.1 DUF1127 domain-containing protein [Ensifer adhaerens]